MSIQASEPHDIVPGSNISRDAKSEAPAESRGSRKTGMRKYPFRWTVLGLIVICGAFWWAVEKLLSGH